MEVALLPLHKDSMAAIFDSSVTAGVFAGCQRMDYLWYNEQEFVPLFLFCIVPSFIFGAVALSAFLRLAVV